LLTGTRNINTDIYRNGLNETIHLILKSAGEYYDLVLIDTAPGNNEISRKIIENSDLITVNLSQNPNTFDNFLDNFGNYTDRSCFIIGRYDDNSRYNIRS